MDTRTVSGVYHTVYNSSDSRESRRKLARALYAVTVRVKYDVHVSIWCSDYFDARYVFRDIEFNGSDAAGGFRMTQPHIYCPLCKEKMKSTHTGKRPQGKLYKCIKCDIIVKIIFRGSLNIMEQGVKCTRRRLNNEQQRD